jgi:glycine oxidase
MSAASDVIIIGAGVMGCAVAWRLVREGLSVTLVERGIPGAEASSAAAGILAPQAEADGPGPFLDLALKSRALYPAFVERLQAETGIDVGYRREGTLSLCGAGASPEDTEAQKERLLSRMRWQARAGLRVSFLEPAEVQRLEPALCPGAGALHFPDDHQVEAPLLCRALSQAAAAGGARFVSAHVQRVRHEGGRVIGVDVEGERLHAGHVLIAAGSWSALLDVPEALPHQAVRPMRGQMLELDTRPPLLRHVVFGHVGRDVSGYLVPRRDGRLIAGSTMELVGFRKEVTVSGLRRLLALTEGLCPALSGAEVRRTWAGFRPATPDGLPLLGGTPVRGLSLCTGHFRNGILLCPVSAEAIASLITGAPPPMDLAPFSVARLLGTNLTYGDNQGR